MQLSTNLEFRKSELKTFKGNDGKDLSMEISTWITENEEMVRLTTAKDKSIDFPSLLKGHLYTVFISTDKMALVSTNELATMYQLKFKLDSVCPFEVKPDKGGNK